MFNNSYLPIIPTLESENLILRPIKLNDAEAYISNAKIEIMIKYVPWKPHQTINTSITFINSLLKEYKNLSSLMWAVHLKNDKKILLLELVVLFVIFLIVNV